MSRVRVLVDGVPVSLIAGHRQDGAVEQQRHEPQSCAVRLSVPSVGLSLDEVAAVLFGYVMAGWPVDDLSADAVREMVAEAVLNSGLIGVDEAHREAARALHADSSGHVAEDRHFWTVCRNRAAAVFNLGSVDVEPAPGRVLVGAS